MEQNAEQIQSQQQEIDRMTALNELAADRVAAQIDQMEQAKLLASRVQLAEIIMEQNAEQIQSQQRKIEELTAVIVQMETDKDRVEKSNHQPVEPILNSAMCVTNAVYWTWRYCLKAWGK